MRCYVLVFGLAFLTQLLALVYSVLHIFKTKQFEKQKDRNRLVQLVSNLEMTNIQVSQSDWVDERGRYGKSK